MAKVIPLKLFLAGHGAQFFRGFYSCEAWGGEKRLSRNYQRRNGGTVRSHLKCFDL